MDFEFRETLGNRADNLSSSLVYGMHGRTQDCAKFNRRTDGIPAASVHIKGNH